MTLNRGVETTFPVGACARPRRADRLKWKGEQGTVFAGVDTHKDSLAVAVIDQAGRNVTTRQLPNTDPGFGRLVSLLARHGVRRVGIEGSGGYGRAAAVHLAILDSIEVVEVPTLLTARERSARPGRGKTDPIDAVAIARVVARDESLPPVRPATGPAADLRALVDYRDQLVAERTAVANRAHAELSGLRPGYQRTIPRLNRPTELVAAHGLLDGDTSVRADPSPAGPAGQSRHGNRRPDRADQRRR